MAYMLVQHEVKDFDEWKKVFDSVQDLRTSNGELSYDIFRDESNSNIIFAMFKWDSMENAQKYAGSPELKEAMENAGVTGPPTISFLNEA